MGQIFEAITTATTHYPNDLPASKIVYEKYQGRSYRAVGESYGTAPSFGERFSHIMAVVGMIFLGIFTLGLPFAFKGIREQFSASLWIAKGMGEVNVHFTPLKPSKWQMNLANPNVGITDQLLNASAKNLPEPECFTWCMVFEFNGQSLREQFPITQKDMVKGNVYQRIENKIAEILQKKIDLTCQQIVISALSIHQPKEKKAEAMFLNIKYDPQLEKGFEIVNQGKEDDIERTLGRFGFEHVIFDGKSVPIDYFTQQSV